MFEFKCNYSYDEAAEIADHYLGLMKQIDKMKRGRKMKVKSLSEISKRWRFISMATIFIAAISFMEYLNKGEVYMVAFAAVLLVYGISCFISSVREKIVLNAYSPVMSIEIKGDGKGMKELKDGNVVKEFTWKEFEYCIVTEKIMTFFGKNKGTMCIGFSEERLETFEHFLESKGMDADYIIKC